MTETPCHTAVAADPKLVVSLKVSQVRCLALHCCAYPALYGVLPTMGAVSLFQGSMIFSLIRHWPSSFTQVST